MKKKLHFLLFAPIMVLLISTYSCQKIKDLVAFDVTQDLPEYHFNLDSTSTSAKDEKIIYADYFALDFDSVLKANNVDAGMISEGKFNTVQLSIENPTPEMNLSFASDLYLKVSLTEDFAETEIMAEAHDINPGDQSVVFTINNSSLKKYLDNKSFYFRVTGNLIAPVPVVTLPLILKSSVVFTVKPLN